MKIIYKYSLHVYELRVKFLHSTLNALFVFYIFTFNQTKQRFIVKNDSPANKAMLIKAHVVIVIALYCWNNCNSDPMHILICREKNSQYISRHNHELSHN